MASPNRPARLNRTLVALTGVVLLVLATLTLLLGSGVLAGFGPGGSDPVAPPSWSPPTWAAYLAIAVAVVLGLLCLRWLVAQTVRKPASVSLRLERDPSAGTTRLDGATAVDPLVDEVARYAGVHRASARLSGTVARPMLHLVVGAEDAADIVALRRRIDAEAIPRLRQALDLPSLPADLIIRLDDARSARLA